MILALYEDNMICGFEGVFIACLRIVLFTGCALANINTDTLGVWP